MKKVSIIIPAYNADKWIGRCLESCIRQDYPKLEIIVVNDGSTDRTLEVCNNYKKKNNNVIVINKENRGVSNSRNVGIKKSTGEYLLFVDADDYIDSNMCARLVECMKDDVDLVVCGYVAEFGNERKEIEGVNRRFVRNDFEKALQKMESHKLLYVCWNKLYRRELILAEFPEHMSFGEDSVFNFSYLRRCETIMITSYAGYHYNVSVSNSAMKRYHLNMPDMMIEEYGEIKRCLDAKSVDTIFAEKHLIDNIIYFALPQLVQSRSISEKEKRREFRKMAKNENVINALKVYPYRRKIHYIVACSIRYKAYWLMSKCIMRQINTWKGKRDETSN